MLTQKLTKRQLSTAKRLLSSKGAKNAYCEANNINRMTLWRMLQGKAVETHHIINITKTKK